jgi:hypothetical protein
MLKDAMLGHSHIIATGPKHGLHNLRAPEILPMAIEKLSLAKSQASEMETRLCWVICQFV